MMRHCDGADPDLRAEDVVTPCTCGFAEEPPSHLLKLCYGSLAAASRPQLEISVGQAMTEYTAWLRAQGPASN